MPEPILQVKDVVKHYPLTRGIIFKKEIGQVRAVDGVSFDLLPGETRQIMFKTEKKWDDPAAAFRVRSLADVGD